LFCLIVIFRQGFTESLRNDTLSNNLVFCKICRYRTGSLLREVLVVCFAALAVSMALHFDICIGISVQNLNQFVKICFCICREVCLIEAEQHCAAEFDNNTFANALNLGIRYGLLYLSSLLVHFTANYGSGGAANRCTDNCAESSIACCLPYHGTHCTASRSTNCSTLCCLVH